MKIFRLPLIFIIAFIAQITLVELVTIKGYKFDIILIVMLFAISGIGCYLPTFAGFGIGLLQDLLSGGFLGLNALAKSIVGFILGQFYSEKRPAGKGSFILVSALCIVLHDFIFNYIYGQGQGLSIIELFWKRALLNSLYNLTVVFLLLLLPIGKRRRK